MSEEPAAAATNKEDGNVNNSTSNENGQQQRPKKSSNYRYRPRYPRKDKTDKIINDDDKTDKSSLPTSNKICRFFSNSGRCRYGDKCRYQHVRDENKAKNDNDEIQNDASVQPAPLAEQTVIMPSKPPTRRVAPSKPVRIILKSSNVGSDEQKKARQTDILYFKRRFAGTVVTNLEDGSTNVKFTYTVSDPEWVFDVKTVTFILTFHPEHPIALVKVDIEQGMMPSPLQIYLIKKFNDILKEKHDSDVSADTFEPIGKWFVRQIDKHILELFIVGLKRTKWLQDAHASGIKVTVFDAPQEPKRELTKPEALEKPVTNRESESSVGSNNSQKENAQPNDNGSSEEESADDENHEKSKTQEGSEATSTMKAPKSAELRITVNWNDSEQSVGTITFTSISGAARCLKCATQEFFDIQNGKEESWKCKKCSTVQSIRFESVLGHQNSNVFGHLYPKGCRPVDCILLSSKLKVACMNCSKDFNVEALPYGTPSLSWCRQCNAKIRFSIDSIAFHGQFNAIPEGEKGAPVKGQKKKNLKDDIMLTPGQPLPKNGTCKHYGKSFRWFRFPCCGKLYPCDECHAANELDHEMKLANRIVCGFCSTEQPYSKESCKHCKGIFIKTNTSFWEGGKGCRNQLAMSKNDNRKYKNSKLKTVPTKRTGPEAKQDKDKK